jgi:hypothetical protein
MLSPALSFPALSLPALSSLAFFLLAVRIEGVSGRGRGVMLQAPKKTVGGGA